MDNKERKVLKGYITGQAITYFFLSILFIRGTAHIAPLSDADKPFLYMSNFHGVPVPNFNFHIDLGFWIVVIVASVILGLSLLYLVTSFFNKFKRVSWVIDIALYLTPYISIFILFSFIVSWANGLSSILVDVTNPVIIGIFAYAGELFLVILFIKTIKDGISYLKIFSNDNLIEQVLTRMNQNK
ncbi:MAG: hypothetical protein ACYDG5_08975 [Dehalococcoidales bacterium]